MISGIGESCHIRRQRGTLVVRAQPVKGVHTLQDISAYQVASLVKNRDDVEVLEIPNVLKKMVNKFTARSSTYTT